jgi:uncharacterized membrane protein
MAIMDMVANMLKESQNNPLMKSYFIQTEFFYILCLTFLILSHKNHSSLGDKMPGFLHFKIWVGILTEVYHQQAGCLGKILTSLQSSQIFSK